MSYRDEEDIFDEDIVFDQAGLLSSARKRGKSAIRRVSSGRCAMLSKTLALCGAFFGLGLSMSLPGPATSMPPTDIDTENGGEEYIYRCLGFMLGSMLGGMLLDRFNRLFLVFLALLVCAILVAMVPWTSITWLVRSDLILLGATMGFLLTGGNVLCLDLWSQNSGPFMQALHFSFSLGAFLAPLMASPLSPAASTIPPITEHHRYPRDISNASLGFAEGLALQPQNFTETSAVPVSSIAPLNTTNQPFVLSQQILGNNSSNFPDKTSSQEVASVSKSTTALPHSTHHTPKPKPEKNSGKNLDRASKWESVHAGQPDPQDVIPISSTKSATSTPSSSSSQALLSSSTPSTVETNETSVANNASRMLASLPIQDIFQDQPITNLNSSKDQGTIGKSGNTEISEMKEEKVKVDVSGTLSRSTETPVLLKVTPTFASSGIPSSPTPKVDVPSSPKPAQPELAATTSSSTVSTTSSTVVLPDKTKSTASTSSSSVSPTPSSSTTPAVISSPEVSPKSLTLTEKKPLLAPLKTSTESPSQSSPTTPTPSWPSAKPPTNDKQVQVTTTPRHHRGKPSTYDNDTSPIYTVMDEVADHLGKEYGLSRLQLSYLLVALLLFVVSLLFLGFLCFNPRDPRSRSEDDVGGGRSNVIRPKWLRITLTTLMMLLLALSAGVQFSYGQLLVLFALRSPLALSLSTGTALTATFWGAATSTRLACILLASALSPGALLVLSVALTAGATWLLSALATQSAAALWVGAVLVAVGTASILPSSFLWMQHHVHVSHHVAGMLIMGPAMGEMLFPPLALRVIKGVGPAGLVHLPALLSLAVIALWAAAWRLARHPCSSLCAQDDPAAHTYQLASQMDEDDLLDLTMSPVTHRGGASVARRTSSHVNGNGVHRLNT